MNLRPLVLAFSAAAFAAPCAIAAPATMSLEEYATLTHDRPYVLGLCKGAGKLLYVGVDHTRDPQSADAKAVQEAFRKFDPTTVLVEGGLPPAPLDSFNASVQQQGEAGGASFLAHKANRDVGSLELPFDDEARAVVTEFGKQQAVVFYALRLVAQERRHNGASSLSTYVSEKIVPWLRKHAPLSGTVESPADLEREARKALPELSDWQQDEPHYHDEIGCKTSSPR